jgi:CHAT domain-containing protein/Tfp pilus assembly protein PilF
MDKRLVTIPLLLAVLMPTSALAFTPVNLAQTQTDTQAEAQRLYDEGFKLFQQQTAPAYQEAIKKWEAALPLWRRVGDKAKEALTLVAIGFVYSALGEKQQALDYYQLALPLRRAVGDRAGEATTLNNIGGVYSALGEKQQALDYYQLALPLRRAVGDRAGEAVTLGNIGYFWENQTQTELAIVFYKQAVNVYETLRGDIKGLSQDLQKSYTETIAGTYRNLADLLLSQDRIYEAQQVLELLKLREVQEFTRSQRVPGEVAQVILLPREQEIINAYGKLIVFAQEIATCEKTNCAQITQLRNQRDKLKLEYNKDVRTLETLIRQRTAQDDQFLLPTAFNQTADRVIQASDSYNAQPGTVVIYPLVLEDKLWLLWASEGKVIGKREVVNVGRQKLNREVLRLRELLQSPNSDIQELQKTSQQLYQWLLQPLEPELAAGKIHHLVFSLDRATRYIPMAVLFDGKQYLIQKYTITTIISAGLTDTSDRLPAKVNDTPILALGVCEAVGYDPLPNVIAEINNIVREENNPQDSLGIYPGKQFLNNTFTWDNLRDNLVGSKLLHIATHGKFVPGDQVSSYLVLGDGKKFRISDIEVLDDYLDTVHLVVLSACETALGDSFLSDPTQEEGIELNALSFYFLSGGAKTVMASLWRVDDSSTSLLMQGFYCNLAQNQAKITKPQSLREAQLYLLEGKGVSPNCLPSSPKRENLAHPHYWAPFILIGNGL